MKYSIDLVSQLDSIFKFKHYLRLGPYSLNRKVYQYSLSIPMLKNKLDDIPVYEMPESIQLSVSSRRHTYLAGRICAKQALIDLGCDTLIGRGKFGEPIWPKGITGSITHTNDFAVAAVVSKEYVNSIGIDTEDVIDKSIVNDVINVCCTKKEQLLFNNFLYEKYNCVLATLIFSAKESFYKAVFPIVKCFIDYKEIEVTAIDWINMTFLIISDIGIDFVEMGYNLIGQFKCDGNKIHTSVSLFINRNNSL